MSLALLLGSVNAACINFRPAPAPLPPALSATAPDQVWSARAGRRFTGHLTLDGGTLYGAGVDRKVYAVDLASGQVQWSQRLSGIVAGGVLLSGDTVYAASSRPEGQVYALDRASGQRLWRERTGPVGAPLALVAGILVVPTQRGDVLGLSQATGGQRWRRRLGTSRVAPAEAGGGAVVIATVDSIFRLTVADGVVSHRVRTPGTVLSSWIQFEGALLAGTTDSQVVALSPADLAVRWSLRVDAPVLGSPAAVGDTLFVATRRGTLYRIGPERPRRADPVVELQWPVTAPVAVVDGQILLGGADGQVRALRTDGTELWRVQLWRPVELGPVAVEDGLVAVGGEGDLHRYRQ
ncbi:MAG TPA: PQQ-binding-like beta-propeller repeat protein [Gemmatimonadales bacterium]|nr:PQQ-binding-like beta-propeller repeat protein [Gemmatimonadales bacterium]